MLTEKRGADRSFLDPEPDETAGLGAEGTVMAHSGATGQAPEQTPEQAETFVDEPVPDDVGTTEIVHRPGEPVSLQRPGD